MSFNYTFKTPLSLRTNWKKWLEGPALELLPGLTRLWPCKPKFWKNDFPANLFSLHILAKCNKFTPALYFVEYKHTFWHVFEKLKHVWVSYISWYVLGSMSLTCLPIFAWQWGRKHNNREKNEAFWVKPHSCLIYDSRCVFFYQSVYFFTNGVYQDFHHNIMFLWFL